MTQGLFIYRAMEEDPGRPKLGTTATKLGIRKAKDIDVDQDDCVHRPKFLPGEPNGLACALAIDELPVFALPKSRGGRHPKTVIWRIEADDLGKDLFAEQDGATHVSIGPAKTMPYNDFVEAIEATQTHWQKVD